MTTTEAPVEADDPASNVDVIEELEADLSGIPTCDARIRPFRPVSEVEVACEGGHEPNHHAGIIRNHAFSGSRTPLTWEEDDKRCFHGEWPGGCAYPRCPLPTGHRGDHG